VARVDSQPTTLSTPSRLDGHEALITAGGAGTRLLPFSKEIPKEMFPMICSDRDGSLILKPLIQAIFEQLHAAGVRSFYIVVGRGKRAIEDHFSVDSGLLEYLDKDGKAWKSLAEFYEKIRSSNLVFLNQAEPRGFGDAVLLGRPVIRGNFLLQAADTFIQSAGDRYLHRLETAHRKYRAAATVLFRDVPDPRAYGVLEGIRLEDGVLRITSAVEKPRAPKSNHAIMPVYVFTDRIFDALSSVPPGKNGELQLTDAIQELIVAGETVIGVRLGSDEVALDIGSPETMVDALRLALQSVDINGSDVLALGETPLVTAVAGAEAARSHPEVGTRTGRRASERPRGHGSPSGTNDERVRIKQVARWLSTLYASLLRPPWQSRTRGWRPAGIARRSWENLFRRDDPGPLDPVGVEPSALSPIDPPETGFTDRVPTMK